MVLKITVKTLDSQNYEFEADDTWSVQQFKEHIQPTVNVSANEQRLIFCGRVLQNDKKLTEYDCNGKVIHLVRSLPPPLNNSGGTSATGTADSNNNNNSNNNGTNTDGSNRENTRFLDENNVLFSAMTLGPDANMNHILRHIFTLQQAIYARNTGDGTPVGGSLEPMSLSDIDRHLHNAARLLRITVNTINECMVRIAALPPNGARSQAERSTLATATSAMGTASSHTDLQRNEDSQTNDNQETRSSTAASTAHSTTTVDDNGLIGAYTPHRVERPNLPRQALTTDDLPHPVNGGVPTSTLLRSQNANGGGTEGNQQSPLSMRRQGETELERYLTILNYSSDLQNQFQGLARRYRQLADMSRLGGLIVPQTSVPSNEARSEAASSTSTESQTQLPNRRATPVSSTLMDEARILGLYIPRILHHISHLQHALSDFTVDFTRGRLSLCSSNNARTGRRHNLSRRSNPPLAGFQNMSNVNVQMSSQGMEPGSDRRDASNAARDLLRPEQTLEGSVTITATAIETTPIMTTTSTTNLLPQANATIVITSEPLQGGPIRIPVSIPHGSINVDFSSTPLGGSIPAQNNERQSATPGQQQHQQPQQQARVPPQATTSNSTQTATRPIGVISGRIPLPFDYFLPCLSPWANYNSPRLPNREGEVPNAPIHLRTSTSRQQAAPNVPPSDINSSNGTSDGATAQPSRNQEATSVGPVEGLAEIVTNLVGSIFRPQQAEQSQQQSANPNPNPDPLFGMIPELALEAATQLLGGVLGGGLVLNQNSTTNNQVNNQQQTNRQQPATTNTSSATVMMDIDIDDSSSSQSESRYQDARESHSPAPSGSNPQTVPIRSSSNLQSNLSSQPGHSQSSSQTQPGLKYNRQQLVEMMQSHPDWIPIIEADIGVMEAHQQVNNNSQPFFSDAYLSSIPRKRRRLLTASPDRVLILQPSPSQAISNLLRRATTNSSPSNTALLDQVLETISEDSDLQSAYEDYIKSAVEARLRTDNDYSPEKFSNSSKYFK